MTLAGHAEVMKVARLLDAGLGPVLHARLAPLAAGLPAGQRGAVLARARSLRLIRRLGPLAAALDG